ncbi:UNVERIFIED_CONTAM: putative transcriptional regulatory protein [Sesamum calycinum]|uniref:Transcriptional regulatory protein n=1 Tax=Sesamum calycinum TaxID=2727403 RepID=A0AAW2LYE4_9LAMI
MERLGDDLLSLIFSEIDDHNDRKSLSQVCKQWLRVEGLQRSSLQVFEPDLLPNFLPRFPNLIKFQASAEISNSLIQFVANTCPRIQVLNLNYREKRDFYCEYEEKDDFDDEGLGDIAKRCCDLEAIVLKRRSGIGNRGVASLGEFSRNLRTLDLGRCWKVSDEALDSIGCLNHLERLDLQECWLITDVGLAFLAQGSLSQNCKHLEVLDLTGCELVTGSGIRAFSSHDSLKELVLIHCGYGFTGYDLEELVLGCASLECIVLDQRLRIWIPQSLQENCCVLVSALMVQLDDVYWGGPIYQFWVGVGNTGLSVQQHTGEQQPTQIILVFHKKKEERKEGSWIPEDFKDNKNLKFKKANEQMPSLSAIRAFGSLLVRFSNGVPLKPSNSFSHHRTVLLSRKLSSLSWYSSSGTWAPFCGLNYGNSDRKISTCPPLCMGRRSCKIAGESCIMDVMQELIPRVAVHDCYAWYPTAQDAKKAKLYARFGKEVVSAVKKGGSSPVSNTALAALFEKAKELDIPRDIIDRNIKRASEKGQEAYIEKFYEVYGYGGAGMIVQVLTDKVNRSVAAVREATDSDKDQLLAIALDAGADDVIEPSMDEDDMEEDGERHYKIVTSLDNYTPILTKLREEGIPFETDSGFELLPLTPIEVDDEAMDLNKELMSKLLELDDVDSVYTDQK